MFKPSHKEDKLQLTLHQTMRPFCWSGICTNIDYGSKIVNHCNVLLGEIDYSLIIEGGITLEELLGGQLI